MDLKDIEKLAALSRINLQTAEKESLLKEMGSILAYVDQVKEASAISGETSQSKPASRNVFRKDENPHPSGTFTETLLKSSPDRHGQYIKVKKIL